MKLPKWSASSDPQDGSAPTSATISFGDVLEKVPKGPWVSGGVLAKAWYRLLNTP